MTYGLEPSARVRASNIKTAAKRQLLSDGNGKRWATLSMQVPGRHNILNALAATSRALSSAFASPRLRKGWQRMKASAGAWNGRAKRAGLRVIDDYGHHPTEIRATLSALRDRYPIAGWWFCSSRTATRRTQSLWKEFSQCFDTPIAFTSSISTRRGKPHSRRHLRSDPQADKENPSSTLLRRPTP